MKNKTLVFIVIATITLLFLITVFLIVFLIKKIRYPQTPQDLISRVLKLASQVDTKPQKCLKIFEYFDTPTKTIASDSTFLLELCKSITHYQTYTLSSYEISEIKNLSNTENAKAIFVKLKYSDPNKNPNEIVLTKTFYIRKVNNKWKLSSLKTL